MEWNAGEAHLRGETYVLVPYKATGLQRVCTRCFNGVERVVWGRVIDDRLRRPGTGGPLGSGFFVFRLRRRDRYVHMNLPSELRDP